jgi:hypothetical protein
MVPIIRYLSASTDIQELTKHGDEMEVLVGDSVDPPRLCIDLSETVGVRTKLCILRHIGNFHAIHVLRLVRIENFQPLIDMFIVHDHLKFLVFL